MEGAAPESGSGDPQTKEWDWNSPYWRKLGAPWGGTHAAAPDVAKFLGEFMGGRGKVVKPETARLMIKNHNPAGFTPRGLGFGVGKESGSPGCSGQTFGHTGSTSTLYSSAWAEDDITSKPTQTFLERVDTLWTSIQKGVTRLPLPERLAP